MKVFKNDSERLEYALTVLNNISELADNAKTLDDPDESLSNIAELATAAHILITRSQHEPAVEMNDLLLEIHEQM